MWQYSVWFSRDLFPYLLALKEEINTVKSPLDICTILAEDDDFSLLLATEDKAEKMQSLIQSKMQEIVAMQYKPSFILKNLKSQCALEDYKGIFLQTLVNFDRHTDAQEVKNQIDFKHALFVDSFYRFKLKNLQKKWLEICALTNDNYSFLNDENVLLELIKFLMSCVHPVEAQINVCEKDDKIVLETENKQIVALKKSFFVNQNNAYELLLTNILSLAPKKVNVFCSKKMDAFSLNVLNNLYGDNFKIVN